MDRKVEMIQQFIERQIVTEKDVPLMDVLWDFYYCLPSMSAYHHKHSEEFWKWFVIVCTRNLEKKHILPRTTIRERLGAFLSFKNSVHGFLAYETYDDDKQLLYDILASRSSMILTQNTLERIQSSASELDSEILSFLVGYSRSRVRESMEAAEKYRVMNASCSDKYMALDDFLVRVKDDSQEISYFNILAMGKWTHTFNQVFDKELKHHSYKRKHSLAGVGSYVMPQGKQHDVYSFWQLGDELVKLGVGYWAFRLNAKGNLYAKGNLDMDFIVPKFLYDAIEQFGGPIPQLENMPATSATIAQAYQGEEWQLDDLLQDTTAVDDYSEADIENTIASNPSLLEDGLSVLGQQFSTAVGFIDLMCRDKDDNLVVVELKKDTGSFEVVGQIQKYMAWAEENLAEGCQVRGIIVAKTGDKQLEYAMKGSKFPIEVKIFGGEAPIPGNIKHCASCGKPNKQSAKYCPKCGNEFWM